MDIVQLVNIPRIGLEPKVPILSRGRSDLRTELAHEATWAITATSWGDWTGQWAERAEGAASGSAGGETESEEQRGGEPRGNGDQPPAAAWGSGPIGQAVDGGGAGGLNRGRSNAVVGRGILVPLERGRSTRAVTTRIDRPLFRVSPLVIQYVPVAAMVIGALRAAMQDCVAEAGRVPPVEPRHPAF